MNLLSVGGDVPFPYRALVLDVFFDFLKAVSSQRLCQQLLLHLQLHADFIPAALALLAALQILGILCPGSFTGGNHSV